VIIFAVVDITILFLLKPGVVWERFTMSYEILR